jgi:hypothetical protein
MNEYVKGQKRGRKGKIKQNNITNTLLSQHHQTNQPSTYSTCSTKNKHHWASQNFTQFDTFRSIDLESVKVDTHFVWIAEFASFLITRVKKMFRVVASISLSTTRRQNLLRKEARALFSTRIRRRRKKSSRLACQTQNDEEAASRISTQVNDMVERTNSNNTFIAKDEDGNELSMDEYLKFASLSPWVPCPDPVARRAFDVAKVGPEDVHYELGSGDGRLNFHAIDSSFGVKKSVGIDIDPSLIHQCNQRKMKIHPAPQHLEFFCADLMDIDNPETIKLWQAIQSECTVMTMYFVEDALVKMKPLLEKYLVGSDCKVVTIGYAMKGWEPQWAESILGLTVHMYDMRNLDMLYNASEHFDLKDAAVDEELNIISKKKVAEMEEEEGENPFADKLPTPSQMKESDEEVIDFHWDFDETVEYDNDYNIVPPNSISEQKKD